MTYEDAVNPANAAPFDDTYAWCFLKMAHYANGDAVYTLIVPLTEPTWYQLCNIHDSTTANSLRLYLLHSPYAFGVRDYYTAGNWECGSLEELIRSAARWRQHPYDF